MTQDGSDVPSSGPAADAARATVRSRLEAPGHAVDNARAAITDLEAAFAAQALQRTPALDAMLADLATALHADTDGSGERAAAAGPGERLGGKSAEAARLILRAIVRELANA